MKKIVALVVLLAMAATAAAGSRRMSVKERFDMNGDTNVDVGDVNLLLEYILDPSSFDEPKETFTVNGVSFTMVSVQGGTFTMGATAEQGSDAYDWEYPAHEVTLDDFMIGETEVTEALWTAVMGSNPSYSKKGDNYPVEYVSWDACQTFITKLNELTGETFRLPTEAEWEYAARGGNQSQGYKYSGGNTIDDVAWYAGNSGSAKHPVATKSPNELGLYDMSGNVWEWCQDWYGSYSSGAQTNPTGPTTGSYRVIRGGGWNLGARNCRVSDRDASAPSGAGSLLGLRLARRMSDCDASAPSGAGSLLGLCLAHRMSVKERFDLNGDTNVDVGDVNLLLEYILDPSSFDNSKETFTVNGVSFTMVSVAGGTFTMGATAEQGSDVYNDEKPAHEVTLDDFMIGETEVTEALWTAVMGSNPSYNKKGDNYPVEEVSWDACQTFISKLNEMTGVMFRLPTEAEWEYAARGGNRSNGYKYAGGNTIGDVAWYDGNSGSAKHPVATKTPNELGLYDMSGNVWEWCQDWYGSYSSGAQTNPTGPTTGSYRVYRGGGWSSSARYCRVSYRDYYRPSGTGVNLGLRLAMGNPNNTFTVNGVSFTMVSVQGGTFTMGATAEQGSDAYSDEEPVHQVSLDDFMIGETEVTEALWTAVMGSNPSYDKKGDNYPVETVSWNDCQTFISKLNALTGETFRLPTEAEWEYAARGGNQSQGYKYSGGNTIDDVAWYDGNSGSAKHPVATKAPNELGLYDMSGNVLEWCQDWKGSYSSGAQTNPTGPTTGSYRVLRGGSWIFSARGCRVSGRNYGTPSSTYSILGLRLAR